MQQQSCLHRLPLMLYPNSVCDRQLASWLRKLETFLSIACVPCFTSSLCFFTGVVFTLCVLQKACSPGQKTRIALIVGLLPSSIINYKYIFFKSFFTQSFVWKLHYLKTQIASQFCQRPYCLRGKTLQDEMLFFFFSLCNNASLLLLFAKEMTFLLPAYLFTALSTFNSYLNK